MCAVAEICENDIGCGDYSNTICTKSDIFTNFELWHEFLIKNKKKAIFK